MKRKFYWFGWLGVFLLGVALGAILVGLLRQSAAARVTIITGYTTTVNESSSALGLAEKPGDFGKGYDVNGAMWRIQNQAWNSWSNDNCLSPLSSGQRIRLGVVQAAPKGNAPGREIVVWFECLQ